MQIFYRDKNTSWKKEFFSIPNCLCYLRILMIPWFVTAYFSGRAGEINWMALLIVFLSGLTDGLDGFIARRFDMVTEWGKIIDPFADKLTQLAIACSVAIASPSTFLLFAVVFIKELVTFIITLIKLKDGLRIDSAMWFGKVATAVFYALMILVIGFGEVLPPYINSGCILITTALMLFAFVRYTIVLLKLKK